MSKLQYHGHPAIAQQIHMYMYVRSTVVNQYGGGVWGGCGCGCGGGGRRDMYIQVHVHVHLNLIIVCIHKFCF